MENVLGLKKLVEQLRRKAAEASEADGASVVVGFSAAYALFVHEDTQAHHEVGQAKFLEEPARTQQKKYAGTVSTVMQRGGTMQAALLTAGLALQADSQRLCPVDKGLLRASAFTRLE